MLQTRYHMAGSQSEIMLRAGTDVVLTATKSFVENVTERNPALAELLNQIALMEQSIDDVSDCEITEQKHGYLRSVLLKLFDVGDAEIICKDRVYSIDMVKREYWSDGKMPVTLAEATVDSYTGPITVKSY